VGAQFFNATMRWDEIGPQCVRFTVTHCRFPELCAAAGEPEVAPLLCKGDAVYFGEVLGSVHLERPHTLAGGGPECPFTLTWR
jgi:predicted ArsR family transcriptional regulator